MTLHDILLQIGSMENGAHSFYKNYLLSPAFSGFLSVSGFIFAMHSFVITKMKEGVYESDAYMKRLKIAANKHKRPVPHYETLKTLHTRLMLCVYFCLGCAISQLLFGYFAWLWMISATLCLVAIGRLVLAIAAMRENMNYLFEELDKVSVEPDTP